MLMHTFFILAATICSLSHALAVEKQHPLAMMEAEHVPGVNGNTTYCTVPRSEQLFHIHFFDIAPLPVPTEQNFFTYLRCWPKTDVPSVEQARLRLSIRADLDLGEPMEPMVITIPFVTTAYDDLAHITIRYRGGKFGGPLQSGKGIISEILTDYWFPRTFLKTGQYTFKIEAFVPAEDFSDDIKYLFAFQVSQWLEGDMR